MSYLSPQTVDRFAPTLPAADLQRVDRDAWRALYRRAPDQDIWHPLPFLDDLIAHMRLAAGSLLVDLACGDGGQISGMPADIKTLGIDQSPEALERAGRRTARTGRHQARFAEAFIESTPVVDAGAGGVVLIDVLSCFLDPMPILREAYRIAAPGAACAITSFTPADPLSQSSGSAPGQPVWIDGFINIFYDPHQIAGLLAGAGFKIDFIGRRADAEAAHPIFREQAHTHDRAIVIGRKTSG